MSVDAFEQGSRISGHWIVGIAWKLESQKTCACMRCHHGMLQLLGDTMAIFKAARRTCDERTS